MYQKLIPKKLILSVSLKALKGREKNDNFFRACFTVDCFKESCLLFVDTMSQGEFAEVVDSSAQIMKIIPSTRIVVWLLYQYKSNLSSLLYKFYTQKPFEPSLVTVARGTLRDGFG